MSLWVSYSAQGHVESVEFDADAWTIDDGELVLFNQGKQVAGFRHWDSVIDPRNILLKGEEKHGTSSAA